MLIHRANHPAKEFVSKHSPAGRGNPHYGSQEGLKVWDPPAGEGGHEAEGCRVLVAQNSIPWDARFRLNFSVFCGNSNVCRTQTSLRIAHAVDRVLHALIFAFCTKTQTLIFSSGSHWTQVCGYSDDSCFSCIAWRFFFLRNVVNVLSSLSAGFMSKTKTWLFPLFSYVYSGRPIWTADLSRLLHFSDPWLLSLLSGSQILAWLCESVPLDCSVPLLAVQALQSLLQLSCGEMCPQGQTHPLCCKVIAARSCSAMSRWLKLNPLCFCTSCSVCVLGCGRHSLFACQTQLFCTWKAPLSPVSLLQACGWLQRQHKATSRVFYQLYFNGICWGTPWCCLCHTRWQLGSQNLNKHLHLKQNSAQV